MTDDDFKTVLHPLRNPLPIRKSTVFSRFPKAKKKRVAQAMHYSLTRGGKRLRPICFETAALFGVTFEQFSIRQWRLEMLHTYSLIHDDLPAWTTLISSPRFSDLS